MVGKLKIYLLNCSEAIRALFLDYWCARIFAWSGISVLPRPEMTSRLSSFSGDRTSITIYGNKQTHRGKLSKYLSESFRNDNGFVFALPGLSFHLDIQTVCLCIRPSLSVVPYSRLLVTFRYFLRKTCMCAVHLWGGLISSFSSSNSGCAAAATEAKSAAAAEIWARTLFAQFEHEIYQREKIGRERGRSSSLSQRYSCSERLFQLKEYLERKEIEFTYWCIAHYFLYHIKNIYIHTRAYNKFIVTRTVQENSADKESPKIFPSFPL